MKALIQRVTSSIVEVDDKIVGQIDSGLLVFVGIEKQDDLLNADKMIERIISYRVFSDSDGKMNLNLKDIGGSILIVSQFTLAADTKNGTRAGFSTAMPPIQAESIYDYIVEKIKALKIDTQCGIFGADMKVSLVNDGPVTFLLDA
jgi:D-tyrosyl-tRNA(Tyr) deacylase|tara:strand:+ start:1765 stop:2202 length:438 start_codon:yes stop_codon:yes gene_type:complete